MDYTLTTKSQVTLPKAIRTHLNVAPGDAVRFRIGADGSVQVVPAQPRAAVDAGLRSARRRFDKLRGSGGHAGAPGTDALMRMLRGWGDDAVDPGFAQPSR